jgi:hypothetical protein
MSGCHENGDAGPGRLMKTPSRATLSRKGWACPTSLAGHRGGTGCAPSAPKGRTIPPCGTRPTAWVMKFNPLPF